MSNDYFRFKQFTIHQGNCAMKVSTDACIQGAWTPVYGREVLDIGTGTGLLSLMHAQKNTEAIIDAIELDATAAKQAAENIKASAWAERIEVINADVTSYTFVKRYDLVICNPPFFSNSLLGPEHERNLARHGLTLSLVDLLSVIKATLRHGGIASILLPAEEHKEWEKLVANSGWYINKRLDIHPRTGKGPNRIVSVCSSKQDIVEYEHLDIRAANDTYTAAFIALLQPYYLNL